MQETNEVILITVREIDVAILITERETNVAVLITVRKKNVAILTIMEKQTCKVKISPLYKMQNDSISSRKMSFFKPVGR